MSPKARDRARAKRRYVKRQAKLAQRQQARRSRQQVLAGVLGVVVVVVGIFGIAKLTGSPAKKTPASAASNTPPAVPTPAGACPTVTTKANSKPEQFAKAPAKTLAGGRTWTATLTTTCGAIQLALDGAKAPQTVSSFIFLARKGFFTDSPCHRLTTSGIFVLQCGDPTGTGSGGPGYGFGIENAPATGDYPAGTVAMARATSPTSNGSQFFIVYKDSKLPTTGGGYTIFGTVSTGLDVVQKVADAGVADGSGDGAPASPISITSVSVK